MTPNIESVINSRSIATNFTKALDADDFESVYELLAPDCQYEIGNKVLAGPDEIIQNYRSGSDKERRLFDHIEFGIEILEDDSNQIAIIFWDRLEIEGHFHTYRLKQNLKFGEDGRIFTDQT